MADLCALCGGGKSTLPSPLRGDIPLALRGGLLDLNCPEVAERERRPSGSLDPP